MTKTLEERVTGAETVRSLRGEIAVEATEGFLSRNPDWIERFGDAARLRGQEDAAFHVDFLAASLALGSAKSFVDYVRWTAQTLGARGIAPVFLDENVRDVARAVKRRVPELADEVDARTIAAARALRDGARLAETSLSGDAAIFCDAALTGRRDAAVRIAREAVRRGGLLNTYADVLAASQREVGARWARADITVADEHRATAVTQYVLAALYPASASADRTRGDATVTGVAGEHHQLGAAIVADSLEADDWDVAFLGTDLPHDAITAAIERQGPSLIGISATLPTNLPAVIDLVLRIRATPAASTATLIGGGGALSAAPDLCRELGLAGPASDVRDAVAIARTLP